MIQGSNTCPCTFLPQRRTLAALVVALSAVSASPVIAQVDASLDVYARPQQTVRLPDGRRINFLCRGTGTPTVLMEAGAGGSTIDWRGVHSALAEHTRVCAYDRAGMGYSDPGPMPRTAAAVVSDLEVFLRAAAIAPPYVLVAHSLGSYYARLYADRHLHDVWGMVLVDPSVEYQDRRFAAASPAYAQLIAQDRATEQECLRLARAGKLSTELPLFKECTYGYARDPAYSDTLFEVQISRRLSVPYRETLFSETDNMDADSAVLAAARRTYGAMPLIVLTQSAESADAYPGMPVAQVAAMNALWVRMHAELASLSSRGTSRVVEHSGHYIQKDRPDVVVDAVSAVVHDSRYMHRGHGRKG